MADEGAREEGTGAVPENGAAGEDSLKSVLETAFNAAAEQSSGEEGAAAEGEVETGEAAAAAAAAEEGKGAPESPEGGEEKGDTPQAVEAPSHWSAKDREIFAKVPAEAQAWLLERFKGMEAAHTRRSQAIKPMTDLAERWNPYFQQLGASAPQAIDLLLQTEYKLRTGSQEQKIAVLRDLVRDYGIQAPGEETAGENSAPAGPDPAVAALTARIDEMQGGMLANQQAAEQAGRAQAARDIEAFANAKGADGKLAHPHFGEVQLEMTRLAQADLAAGVQPNLENLYERAMWSTPRTRELLLEAQKSAEAERQREAAEKARKAGGQVSGAGAPVAEQPKGLRATLEAAYDKQAAA